MIRTVTGKICTSDVKNVLLHEHIQCVSNDMLHVFGDDWCNNKVLAEYAAEVLTELNEKWDINLIVDGTPIDLGRNIGLLKSVSEKSGTYIVASTGLYHYPSFVTGGNDEIQIASWFLKECSEGAEKTGVFPGILKCASAYETLTRDEKKRITAMSYVAKETGLSIYVHCPHKGNIVKEQLDILLKNGVGSHQIIIGHCGLKPESDYLEEVLKSGCYISMDQCHCTQKTPGEIGKSLYELCEKGCSSRIILANDMCIYSDFSPRNLTGMHLTYKEQAENFGFVLKKIVPAFKAFGGTDEDITKMFRTNALKVLDI